MNAFVLTVSDRVSNGVREDESGPLAADLLVAAGFSVTRGCVPDERDQIADAVRAAARAGADVVVTTGGTGLGPRDVTPEATAQVLDRAAPGIADAVRAAGAVATAMFSRGTAGVLGRTLVVNLAGSPGAVRDGLTVLLPVFDHAVSQIRGGDH